MLLLAGCAACDLRGHEFEIELKDLHWWGHCREVSMEVSSRFAEESISMPIPPGFTEPRRQFQYRLGSAAEWSD